MKKTAISSIERKASEATTAIPEKFANFAPTEVKKFQARQVVIFTLEKTPVEVHIPGKKEPVTGFSVISQNTVNPNLLEINVLEGEILSDPEHLRNFIVKKGAISISGEKNFEPLDKLSTKKGEFKLRDPDLIIIDNQEFRQTGTIQIKTASLVHMSLT